MRFLLAACLVALAGCTIQDGPYVDENAFRLTMADPTATADGLRFTLRIAGDLEVESDHIGGHYWNMSVADPTAAFGAAAGACTHMAADIPGSFDVTCALPDGTWHVYGHLRVVEDDATYNYWTEGYEVTVTGMSEA